MGRLHAQLERISSSILDYPGREALRGDICRHPAAVCVLFSGPEFDEASVLLIERSVGVKTHRGQVAFPGGQLDPIDDGDAVRAAFRECGEETGIPFSELRLAGELPAFPTLTGDFEVIPIVASVDTAFALAGVDPQEVAFAEWVSVRQLRASREFERVNIQGREVDAPVFWWGKRKMWGLSAWIFDLVLRRHGTIGA